MIQSKCFVCDGGDGDGGGGIHRGIHKLNDSLIIVQLPSTTHFIFHFSICFGNIRILYTHTHTILKVRPKQRRQIKTNARLVSSAKRFLWSTHIVIIYYTHGANRERERLSFSKTTQRILKNTCKNRGSEREVNGCISQNKNNTKINKNDRIMCA